MGFRNVRNPIGVYPHSALPAAREVLDRLGTPFVYLKSVAEAALHNPNMIVHTVGAVMSIPRIEATHGDFCMYHEAFTPSAWNLLEALDGEKMRVLEQLGCDPVPYVEACKFRNSLDDARDAKEVFFAYAAMPERAKGAADRALALHHGGCAAGTRPAGVAGCGAGCADAGVLVADRDRLGGARL
ncbi:MAG: NAD/NADP octopine/nopaline dehydrogenase family protein [Oscillospiraceae bacterium]